jgi:AcrR family transcriptional regulator
MATVNKGSRDKILKAALTLFTQKGIKSTTTKELAKKAGIAEGTIYVHFKSKEQIANYLFRHYMELFGDGLFEQAKTVNIPVDKIKLLIKAFFDFAEKEPKATYFIVIAHYTELNILTKEKYKFRNIFADAIRKGINANTFMKINADLGAALIIGMINRAILSYNEGFIRMNYHKMVDETTKAALKLLSKNN